MIWCAQIIPRVAVLKLMSSRLETGVSGNLWSFLNEVKPLVVNDVEHGKAMEPMQGKWASSRVHLWYIELFFVPNVTSVFFSSCDSFLGTLWSSIKQIEAPYMFDWEHGSALHAMQGDQASSLGGKCDDFSRLVAGTWGTFSSYGGDGH